MIPALRKWLGSAKEPAPLPSLPGGTRAYAVGDVHGRLDLFTAMIEAILADNAARGPASTTLVLLGDLIDRGPESAGVLDAARDLRDNPPPGIAKVHILLGNHEEMLLESLERVEVLRQFTAHGGKETILSLGVSEDAYSAATWEELLALLRAAVPTAMQAFLRGMEHMVRLGDYAFVHAGIKPGVPLETQSASDLRWIREPFLSSPDNHGAVIVHGHSITDDPVLRPNRIGIDTGAYASGRLTALVLEDTRRWLLTASASDLGAITTSLQQAD